MKTAMVVATLMLAIIAGLMYAYACSVNPGLRKLKDIEYVHAMQSINRAILNPWFLVCFIGTILMQGISGWLVYRSAGTNQVFVLVCLSSLIYFSGVFMLTGAGNVPLNDALVKIQTNTLTPDALRQARAAFEIPWNKFHLIRTIASVVSLLLMLIALIRVRS